VPPEKKKEKQRNILANALRERKKSYWELGSAWD
jgi:hypothetical protein